MNSTYHQYHLRSTQTLPTRLSLRSLAFSCRDIGDNQSLSLPFSCDALLDKHQRKALPREGEEGSDLFIAAINFRAENASLTRAISGNGRKSSLR